MKNRFLLSFFVCAGFATDEILLSDIDEKEIESCIQKIRGKTFYYNAKIHKACFSLPNFILENLQEDPLIAVKYCIK